MCGWFRCRRICPASDSLNRSPFLTDWAPHQLHADRSAAPPRRGTPRSRAISVQISAALSGTRASKTCRSTTRHRCYRRHSARNSGRVAAFPTNFKRKLNMRVDNSGLLVLRMDAQLSVRVQESDGNSRRQTNLNLNVHRDVAVDARLVGRHAASLCVMQTQSRTVDLLTGAYMLLQELHTSRSVTYTLKGSELGTGVCGRDTRTGKRCCSGCCCSPGPRSTAQTGSESVGMRGAKSDD